MSRETPSLSPARCQATARELFREILVAVDYCHQQGVYHRDLKLENVLRMKDGALKVTDFGMAKDTSIDSMPKTRRIGTIAYMAPEVADAGEQYDGAGVDVWSCGVMLYVMIVCNYPFGHDGARGAATTLHIRQSCYSCCIRPTRRLREMLAGGHDDAVHTAGPGGDTTGRVLANIRSGQFSWPAKVRRYFRARARI